ncbi:MAG: hypothetical protein JWP91_3018 [Fibrobacteres bacterium]|nr:hypothetical protein [Fibrobacterota bacterium]
MATYAFQQNKFIFIFAGLMLLAGAVYYAYRIADGAFLTESESVAKVVGKEHVPFSEQYRMQNIGGVNRTVKIAVPETWLLLVDLNGSGARAGVDPEEFRTIPAGTEVRVRYKRRRISGNLQVTRFLGRAGG